MKSCISDVRCVRTGLALLVATGMLVGPIASPAVAGCWRLVVQTCEDCNDVPPDWPSICYQEYLVGLGCLIIQCQSADGPCQCDGFIEYMDDTRNNIVGAPPGMYGKADYEVDRNVVCAYSNPCEELCEAASCLNSGNAVEWTCPSYKLTGNICTGGY